MTRAVLAEARRLGYRVGIVGPTPESRTMYERLGFVLHRQALPMYRYPLKPWWMLMGLPQFCAYVWLVSIHRPHALQVLLLAHIILFSEAKAAMRQLWGRGRDARAAQSCPIGSFASETV
jgi:hypothetical protein